jgi:zeta-carotene desaturase
MAEKEIKDAIIIGAGTAGMAAAAKIAETGKAVTLIEASSAPGGRARTIEDQKSGEHTDNGQHMAMGAYHGFLKFLGMLGTDDKFTELPPLRMYFLTPENKYKLDTRSLSGRIGAVRAMAGFDAIDWRSKLKMGEFAAKILAGAVFPGHMTAEEVLRENHQTEQSINNFWQPLIIATMNAPIEKASGRVFIRILELAFFGNPDDARMMLPSVPIGELFAPIDDYLKRRNGEIIYDSRAQSVDFVNNRFLVTCSGGRKITAKSLIAAVPPNRLKSLTPRIGGFEKLIGFCEQIDYSPIVSIYIRSRKKLYVPPMAALLRSRLQWIFDRNYIIKQYNDSPDTGRYTITISAADEIFPLPQKEIVDFCAEELMKFFPRLKKNDIIDTKVVKDAHATPLITPGTESIRPANDTNLNGFFVAGDWTDTRLPATLESAARSGFSAAEKCLDFLDR